MLPITYRGPKDFITILTRFRGEYSFNISNNFKVTPNSWEDFYDIMLLNTNPQAREFVLAKDPLIDINERRVVIETDAINPEIVKKQLENEEKERLRNKRLSLIDAYKTKVMTEIAEGIRASYPTTIEEDAIAYADAIMNGVPDEEATPILPPTDAEEGEEGTSKENLQVQELETKPGIEGPAIEGETLETTSTEETTDENKEASEDLTPPPADPDQNGLAQGTIPEGSEQITVDTYIEDKKKKNK